MAGQNLRSVAPLRLPREAGLLAFSIPLAAALAIVTAPDRADAEPPAIAREAAAQARKLELIKAPADVAAEVARIVVELKSADVERITAALTSLSELEVKATRRLLDGAGRDAEALRALADQAAASGSSLGRFAPAVSIAPGALAEKLNRADADRAGDRSTRPAEFAAKAVPSGGPSALAAQQIVGESLSRRDWDPRYDELVQAYFEVNR